VKHGLNQLFYVFSALSAKWLNMAKLVLFLASSLRGKAEGGVPSVANGEIASSCEASLRKNFGTQNGIIAI